MADALVTAVQSMQNDQRRMESINRNIANVATPGYQREVSVVRPFAHVFEGSGAVAVTDAQQGGVGLDTRGGAPLHTGKPFDLALGGPGYFVVQTNAGPAYTRAGGFHLDGAARLVNASGKAVLSDGGGDIVVRGAAPTIDAQGRISQDGRVVAQLKVVQFAKPGLLTRGADGLLYATTPDAQPAPVVRASMQVGYLEGSNASATAEMTALTDTVRHFESAQKVYQIYDEQVRSAIQELGKF